jgi:hypothetical protein
LIWVRVSLRAPGWVGRRNMGALVQQNMEALQAEHLRASGTNLDFSAAPSALVSESSMEADLRLATQVYPPRPVPEKEWEKAKRG